MKKLLKIYGERNTTTNYLAKVVDLNLSVQQLEGTVPNQIIKIHKLFPRLEFIRDLYFQLTFSRNLGWKHTRVKSMEELNEYKLLQSKLYFITITKNPYSWLLSLYKNPYHQYYTVMPSFEEFLKRPWKTVHRDNTKRMLANPIELWNIKNSSYLQLNSERTLNLTTEGILRDIENTINLISQSFSIPKKLGKFSNYDRSTKQQGKDSEFYRNYYLKEIWRQELTATAIDFINSEIDQELMSSFEYSVIN